MSECRQCGIYHVGNNILRELGNHDRRRRGVHPMNGFDTHYRSLRIRPRYTHSRHRHRIASSRGYTCGSGSTGSRLGERGRNRESGVRNQAFGYTSGSRLGERGRIRESGVGNQPFGYNYTTGSRLRERDRNRESGFGNQSSGYTTESRLGERDRIRESGVRNQPFGYMGASWRFACKMRPKILPCLQRLEAKESNFLLFLMQYLYCMCLYPMNNCARTRIVH